MNERLNVKMSGSKYEEEISEFSREFKVKVVELSNGLNVQVTHLAETLGLRPMTIHRWRQEHKDGELFFASASQVHINTEIREPYITQSELTEIRRLRNKNIQLQNEVDALKNWQGHLSEYCKRSPSSESPDSLSTYF